ncbi:MAG TPA: DUF4352 domain-containing protein, partial [Ktedonobacteraceae bacterium]
MQQPPSGEYPSRPPFMQRGSQPYWPAQQAYQPPMQPFMLPVPVQSQKQGFQMGWAGIAGMTLIGVLIGVLIGYIVRGIGDGTGALIASGPASSTTVLQPASIVHHKIGEAVSVDNKWQVTLNQVHFQQPDEINQPQKAGNVYLMIDVTMKNISNEQQTASSLIQFDLRTEDGMRINES